MLAIAAATWLCLTLPAAAGTYTSSAHGSSTTGVNRTSLNNATTGEDYSIGNCAHCHEQHASVEGAEPAPDTGPANYLGMAKESGGTGAEQSLCLHCHGLGGNGAGGAPDNIFTDISKTGGRHNMAVSDSAHRANETQSQINSNRHVECTDCHNPHAAGKTMHTKGIATGNEIAATTPLHKATGVVPSFSGSNWTAPTSYSAIQTATKEYQVCFKCHSGAVGNPATWSGTSGSTAWTDVGLEFSPKNKSFHPIVAGLASGGSGSSALTAGQLSAPWNTNVGTQTMFCSDCHASDSAVAGPHGSGYKWMLTGTNKAWPFTSAASNGANSGTYRLITSFGSAAGTDSCFCWNCHPNDKTKNTAHSQTQHHTSAFKPYCVDCHIRVPHGGKVSRLIAADNNASYTNLPARYTANGEGKNSSGGTAPMTRKFTKQAPGSYGFGDCYTPQCGAKHNSSGYGSETW